MGLTHIRLNIANPAKPKRAVQLSFLMDSGAIYSVISLDDDGWKSVRPYLRQHKINYRIVIGTMESAAQFGVDKGMPVSLLIDRVGKIADVHPGVVDKDAFEREIQTLLKETANKAPN